MNEVAMDPLQCHFGGAEERFSALVARRQLLHRPPVVHLESTGQMQGAVASAALGGVALVLFDSEGAVALRPTSAGRRPDHTASRTLLDHLPLVTSDVCERNLPEVAAYSLATASCDLVWGVHPAAIVLGPAGARVLLYAAFTDTFRSSVDRAQPESLTLQGDREGHLAKVLATAWCRRAEKPVEDEVKEPLRHPIRRLLHQTLVKPCLPSRKHLAAHVERECAGANSVIDVSAGDDTIALTLAKAGLDLVVANDIAFADMQRMGTSRSRRPPANLVLTSRPIEHLEFDRRFDVALLKNTLHHFTSAAEVSASLRALERLARRLVFVEIEDPSLNVRGKAWNFYYERLLGDGGDDHRFYDMLTFRQVLLLHFPEAASRFGSIRTGRGNYLVATLDIHER